MKKLITTSIILGSMIFYTIAQVIHVPADQPAIQAAINASADGDTVLVDEGTYYENINFKGKAIAVASLFIIDGDTTHISKTIIDGSQATNPDTASVVTMCSGEDTTSVLMGFTITGGGGTIQDLLGGNVRCGGGVNIHKTGGKIIHNIIEENHLSIIGGDPAGAGIHAWGDKNRATVIRHNIIRENTADSSYSIFGVGACLVAGRIIFEQNYVTDNNAVGFNLYGPGIAWFGSADSAEVFIRKNIFTGNSGYGDDVRGGGICVGTGPSKIFEISDNILSENYVDGVGGGMWAVRDRIIISNNTFYNNDARDNGRNLILRGGGIKFFNNIAWSDKKDNLNNFAYNYYNEGEEPLYAYNNLLSEPIYTNNKIVSGQNTYIEPLLKSGTFEPAENSPAVGRGVDSVLINGKWFYAPASDFYGTERLAASEDRRIDIGAVESPYNAQPWYNSEHVINVPGEQYTIQAGIDAASEGDTVLVSEGLYYENINFRGKAITVAGKYLLDGDTSHISRTIIDGTLATNPDTTSVVTMCSGEDTTSVLMGFAITGGSGTVFYNSIFDRNEKGGGGIFIYGSGGKIINNHIRENRIEWNSDISVPLRGGGLFASVFHDHSLVVRNNKLISNSLTSNQGNIGGGGLVFYGGSILCENNDIVNNSIQANGAVFGGGLMLSLFELEGVIKNATIRSNLISWNTVISTGYVFGGGGYSQHFSFGEENTLVYNNIIANNQANWIAGGIMLMEDTEGRFFNNTVTGNVVTDATEAHGNSIYIYGIGKFTMYNNIIWSGRRNEIEDISYAEVGTGMKLFNNILKEEPSSLVSSMQNICLDPLVDSITFMPGENSPAIGRGIDSLEVQGTWYYTSRSDFNGKSRPDPVDQYPDIGAVESAWPRPVLDNADLKYIGYFNLELIPAFDKDTLDYEAILPDHITVPPTLNAIPADYMAEVDIDHATDMEENSTTTITVTAENGTSRKEYTVFFRYKSNDVSLCSLSANFGELIPEFSSETKEYDVIVNDTCPGIGTPQVTYTTCDSRATAQIITDALNICDGKHNKTVIRVTAENGITTGNYKITFQISDLVPSVYDLDISIYPNPVTQRLFIKFNEATFSDISVSVVDISGRLMTKRNFDHIVPNREETLDLSFMKSGLYFLEIRSEENSRVYKIIKE